MGEGSRPGGPARRRGRPREPQDEACSQRLEDASDLFAQHAGFALSGLVTPDVWHRLRRAFAQRHVLVHKNGHVDQPFLDQVPESSLAVGQRLVITRTEAEQAMDDVELLITAIEAQVAPTGAP